MTGTLIPGIEVLHGDCIEHMRAMPDACIDAVVTDPPYMLSFMGAKWDAADNIAGSPEVWREVLRVMKPGGHMLAFGAPRTYHRMACAIEDAGFEIRDCIRSLNGQDHYPAWVFGQGFPKAEQWTQAKADAGNAESAMMVEAGFEGWARGGLKPAWEPIVLARKLLSESGVAANVLKHGTGGLNIDGCRVGIIGDRRSPCGADGIQHRTTGKVYGQHAANTGFDTTKGRFPSNVIHDGSDEVLAEFARFGSGKSGIAVQRNGGGQKIGGNGIYGGSKGMTRADVGFGDSGTAARYFMACKPSDEELNAVRFHYSAKASKQDRAGSTHPTVKPINLIRYLCRLITPPGGLVLDPFAGSGTTLAAAHMEGFRAIGIEQQAEHIDDIRRRIAALAAAPQPARQGGLFADLDTAE